MIEVISKVEDTISIINSSDIVIRMAELKKLINSDTEIQQLIAAFSRAKDQYCDDSTATNDLSIAKKDLYNHSVVAEYRKLYSELNLSLAKFNKDLSSLLSTSKACSKI